MRLTNIEKFNSLSECNRVPVKVGRYWVRTNQTENSQYGIYSKKWHSQFGPCKWVNDRRVEFASTSDFKKIVVTVELNAWRSNWRKVALKAAMATDLSIAWE